MNPMKLLFFASLGVSTPTTSLEPQSYSYLRPRGLQDFPWIGTYAPSDTECKGPQGEKRPKLHEGEGIVTGVS